MNEKSIKRRAWIKNIAIIFLSIMLILTFFSNTIMNYSLPEVSAQYPQSGTITSKVRGTGTVEANQNYQISIEETRKIASVEVKVNQRVEKDDTILILEDTESEELKNAVEELERIKLEYEKMLLEAAPDYSADLLELNNALEDLNKARTERMNITDNSGKLAEARQKVKDAEKAVKEIEKKIDKINSQIALIGAKDEYDPSGATSAEKLESAKIAYENASRAYENAKAYLSECKLALENSEEHKAAMDDELAAAQNAKTSYENNLSGGTVKAEELIAAKREIESMMLELERARELYQITLNNAYNSFVKAGADFGEKEAAFKKGEIDENEYNEAIKTYNYAVELYNNIIANTDDSTRMLNQNIQDIEIRLLNAQEDYSRLDEKFHASESSSTMLATLNQAVEAAQNNVNSADKAVKKASEALTEAEELLAESKQGFEEAETNVKDYEKLSSTDVLESEKSELEKQLDEANALYESAADEVKTIESAGGTSETEAESRITELERRVKSLRTALEARQSQDDISESLSKLELNSKKKDIEKQEKLIDELRSKSIGTIITAPVSGVITSLNYVAGETVNQGSEIAEIQISDKGYLMKFSVTNEQAQRIKLGDTASPQYYWGSELKATVTAINNDPSNPGKGKIITLSISGDAAVGQSLTFSLGESGKNYDTVLPNKAINSDNNGKFILVVTAKNTPLGNRYIASRVDVQVIESDENVSAVSGVINGGDFVIVTSNKPITAGMQVRLVES